MLRLALESVGRQHLNSPALRASMSTTYIFVLEENAAEELLLGGLVKNKNCLLAKGVRCPNHSAHVHVAEQIKIAILLD
jgi:hypothetical protein